MECKEHYNKNRCMLCFHVLFYTKRQRSLSFSDYVNVSFLKDYKIDLRG